jgi:hypothetical protein
MYYICILYHTSHIHLTGPLLAFLNIAVASIFVILDVWPFSFGRTSRCVSNFKKQRNKKTKIKLHNLKKKDRKQLKRRENGKIFC